MMRSASLRSVLFGLSMPLALALSSAACSSPNAEAQAPTTASAASAQSKAPITTATHGPTKLIADALGEVALRPEQRVEIEKMVAEAEARHAPARQAHAEIAAALADQIEKNAIDSAALRAKVDAAAAALARAQAGDRAALQRLHDILDANQRAALVAAIRASMQAHRDEMKQGGPHARMKQWADDIGLTEEQRAKLRSAMHDEMHAHAEEWRGHGDRPHHEASFDAFQADTFAIDAAMPPRDVNADVHRIGDRLTSFVELVLPELTAEQRVRAAATIRAHADMIEGSP